MLTEQEIAERVGSGDLRELIESARPQCHAVRCEADAVWLVTVFCARSSLNCDYLFCQGCRNLLVNLGLRAWSEANGHEHTMVHEKLVVDPGMGD